MKKWIFASLLLSGMALSIMAQDDLYFVPKKAKTSSDIDQPVSPRAYQYSGSTRNVDEYNRMGGSRYEVLPADTGDIITFAPVEGVYPDSTQDYSLTRKMARWDGYEPSVEYWDGYAKGRSDARMWHSPWYYSSYYPWYDRWYYDPWYYDPWYYSSWYWYDPWYSGYWGWGGYYGWHRPWHYGGYWGGGGGGGHVHNGNYYSGSYRNRPHGVGSGRYTGSTGGTRRGGSSIGSSSASRGRGVIGTRRSTIGTSSGMSTRQRTTSSIGAGSYNSGPRSLGSRPSSSGSSYTPSSTRSSGGSYSGGSFSGGSRGSSGGGGGSRGGGGVSGSSRR